MNHFTGFVRDSGRSRPKTTQQLKRRKLQRKAFVNDGATIFPKWKPYYALKDKHLRLHFSNGLIQQTLYENRQINRYGQIKMVHPWKGFQSRRYYTRRYPYNDHFVGYHGFSNPDIVFRKRKKSRPSTKFIQKRSYKPKKRNYFTSARVRRKRAKRIQQRFSKTGGFQQSPLVEEDGLEILENGSILPSINSPQSQQFNNQEAPQLQ